MGHPKYYPKWHLEWVEVVVNLLLNGTCTGCAKWNAELVFVEDVVTVRPSPARRARRSSGGFSLVELVMSIVILMILSAIAIPTLTRAYRSYLLSDATSRFAAIVKLTRFEAIRRNTQITLRVQQNGATWTAWTDTNNNGIPDATENQTLLNQTVSILPPGSVPSPAPITSSIGPAITTFTVQSGSSTSVTYDGRGAINFGGGSPAVYFYYLGNPAFPDLGARAVILLPSGIVQLWSSVSGTWKQVS